MKEKRHQHKFNFVDYIYAEPIRNEYDIYVKARYVFICICGKVKIVKAKK